MYKKLLSQTVIYGLTGILGRLLNYLLTPIHTEIFATQDYGGIALFYSYAAFLNVIYTHGMETTYFRFISKQKEKNGVSYQLALASVLLTSLILSSLLWFFAKPVAIFLEYPDQYQFVQWFACIIAIDSVVAIPYARLRAEGKALKFASLRTFVIVLTVLLNGLLYVSHLSTTGEEFLFFKPIASQIYDVEVGLGYVFLINLFANSLVLPLLWTELKDFRPVWDWKSYKPMILYAYPLLFSGIAYAINEVADRTLLQKWLPTDFYPDKTSMEALGIYAACYKLSIFITLAVQAFKYAAEPFFFAQTEDKNSPKTFATVTHFFTVVCVLMLLFVSFNMDWIATVFIRNKAYHEGLFVVPILLLANVFLGLYYNFSVWYKISDRTHFGLWISLAGAVVTLTLNFILIPKLGYLGSALATLSCYFVMAALCYGLGQTYQKVPYPIFSMLAYIGVAMGLVFTCMQIDWTNQWQKISIQNGTLLVFVAATLLLERRRFRQLKSN